MACAALVDGDLFLVPPERVVESAALLNAGGIALADFRLTLARPTDGLSLRREDL